jgi:hypothetical protein
MCSKFKIMFGQGSLSIKHEVSGAWGFDVVGLIMKGFFGELTNVSWSLFGLWI